MCSILCVWGLFTMFIWFFCIIDAPIQSKKHQFSEQQKLKQLVSKNVNRSVEEEIRGRAKEGHINLSKAQQAVAKQQKEKASCSDAPSTSNNWVQAFECYIHLFNRLKHRNCNFLNIINIMILSWNKKTSWNYFHSKPEKYVYLIVERNVQFIIPSPIKLNTWIPKFPFSTSSTSLLCTFAEWLLNGRNCHKFRRM